MPYPAKLSRTAVVAAALALLDARGRDALGMRAVGDVLGVRPASLYKHVGDLAGLETLLAEAAAAALADALDAALAELAPPRVRPRSAGRADPAAALRAVATAYVGFAREHPARYALLTTVVPATVVPGGPATGHSGDERKALWIRLLAVVGALTGDADDTGAAVAVWAFLHGFVALEQAGLYGASGPRGGLARGVDALARGLRATARAAVAA